MFAQRYALIQQRILRQDIFQPKLVRGMNSEGANHTLTPVESLLGRSGRRFLLGMIVQVRRGVSFVIGPRNLESQLKRDVSRSKSGNTTSKIILARFLSISRSLHCSRMDSSPKIPSS